MRMRFVSHSVADKLYYGDFEHLTERDKKKLVRLMARISEKSYRRGAQQGVVMAELGAIPRDLHAWRYHRSLDKSPGLDDHLRPGGYRYTAIDQLGIQNSELSFLGFDLRDTERT